MSEVIIKNGANGLYKDDGENLSRVDQSGNGSEKAESLETIAKKLQSNGD